MIGYITQGIILGFAAAVQPGPFQTYIIAQTVRNGWRRSAVMAFAPLVSDGPIIVLALLVLSQVPDSAQRMLHVAGGLFVLYLAWGAFRRWHRSEESAESSGAESAVKSLFNAAVMNLLNPGPYIFWSLVAGPLFMEGWRASPAHGVGFAAAFYAAMIATLTALIVTFGAARKLGPRVQHYLFGASALALGAFGFYQLYRGIAG